MKRAAYGRVRSGATSQREAIPRASKAAFRKDEVKGSNFSKG